MKINEYILRYKSESLLNQPSQKLSVEVINPGANIIDSTKSNIHLIKECKLIISNKINNEVVADFKIGLQSDVLLEEKETFSDEEFNHLIMPVIYVHITDMINDMKLPQISYSDFSEFFLGNK